MSKEFEIDNKDGNKYTVHLNEDGTIEIPGYDYNYDILAISLGESTDTVGPCYWLLTSWDVIYEAIKKQGDWLFEKLLKEMNETYYERRRIGHFAWDEVRRSFNVDDLVEFLAEHVLLEQIKDDDPAAETTASLISKLPVSTSLEPDIHIKERDEDIEMGEVRYSEYKLKIGETTVAEWEYAVERRIIDSFYFETEVDDLTGQLDMGPTPTTEQVLKAFGITPPDPDPPDEFSWVPEADKTGNGVFGVMYERLKYEPGVHYENRKVEEVDVVVYDDERTATEALILANRLQSESGDHEYRITLVRRKTPSEREADAALAMDRELRRHQGRLFEPGVEEVPEPDPLYMEWIELEDDEEDRPEDFEG